MYLLLDVYACDELQTAMYLSNCQYLKTKCKSSYPEWKLYRFSEVEKIFWDAGFLTHIGISLFRLCRHMAPACSSGKRLQNLGAAKKPLPFEPIIKNTVCDTIKLVHAIHPCGGIHVKRLMC